MGRRKNGAARPDMRAALIRAASEVFSRDGFDSARVEEIANRAGVAKGSVYNHFEDKFDLFVAVFVTETDEWHQDFLERKGDRRDFVGVVELLLESHLTFMPRHQCISQLIFGEHWLNLAPDLRVRITRQIERHMQSMADILADAARADSVDLRDPIRFMRSLSGLGFFFSQHRLLITDTGDYDPATMRADIRYIRDLLLHGVLRANPSAGKANEPPENRA